MRSRRSLGAASFCVSHLDKGGDGCLPPCPCEAKHPLSPRKGNRDAHWPKGSLRFSARGVPAFCHPNITCFGKRLFFPQPSCRPDSKSAANVGLLPQSQAQTSRFFRRKNGTVYWPKGSLNFSRDRDPVPVFLSR